MTPKHNAKIVGDSAYNKPDQDVGRTDPGKNVNIKISHIWQYQT